MNKTFGNVTLEVLKYTKTGLLVKINGDVEGIVLLKITTEKKVDTEYSADTRFVMNAFKTVSGD